ncbi:MAG TPA: hypothetical protein VFZ61_17210 [Polyangiales bacterium]
MDALGPLAALRASLALLGRRPYASVALGLALYTSSISVCCGFGVIATPWFACELLALLLSVGLEQPLPRTRSWLWAGLIQMFTVIVLTSVASLALMSFGVLSVNPSPLSGGHGLWLQLGEGLLVGAVAGALVLSLTVYFEHAPSILIERGGGFTAALLESARLVSLHGAVRTWLTSALARGLPLLGGVLGMAFLTLGVSGTTALVFLFLLVPLLVLCMLLGQGMLAAAYLHLRDQVTDPRQVPFGGEPSKRGTAVWTLLLSCVALGPVLVTASLLKPSVPRAEAPPPQLETLLSSEVRDARPRTLYVPHSALRLVVSSASVRVVASDGGGAGDIPLPQRGVRGVRVARMQSPLSVPRGESTLALGIQLADGRVVTTWLDEAGVRLDDTWERRLSLRLSPWSAGLLVLCFAWTAIWIARTLPPQARIRRKLSGQRTSRIDLGGFTRPSAPELPDVAGDGRFEEHEQRLRAALRARVIAAAIWLLPPALGSVAIGLSALLA